MAEHAYHHGDLPAALLARAEQALRAKGVGALSLREIARDVGVSPGAPSRHFKSKQALLDALALSGFDRLAAAIDASQKNIDDTFAARMDAAARAYVQFAVDNSALLDLMFQVKYSPEASEALRGSIQRWSDQLLSLIRDGQERGEVREGSVERIALPVFATLQGFTILNASGMLPPEMTEHALDDLIESILRGCAPR